MHVAQAVLGAAPPATGAVAAAVAAHGAACGDDAKGDEWQASEEERAARSKGESVLNVPLLHFVRILLTT